MYHHLKEEQRPDHYNGDQRLLITWLVSPPELSPMQGYISTLAGASWPAVSQQKSPNTLLSWGGEGVVMWSVMGCWSDSGWWLIHKVICLPPVCSVSLSVCVYQYFVSRLTVTLLSCFAQGVSFTPINFKNLLLDNSLTSTSPTHTAKGWQHISLIYCIRHQSNIKLL